MAQINQLKIVYLHIFVSSYSAHLPSIVIFLSNKNEFSSSRLNLLFERLDVGFKWDMCAPSDLSTQMASFVLTFLSVLHILYLKE